LAKADCIFEPPDGGHLEGIVDGRRNKGKGLSGGRDLAFGIAGWHGTVFDGENRLFRLTVQHEDQAHLGGLYQCGDHLTVAFDID